MDRFGPSEPTGQNFKQSLSSGNDTFDKFLGGGLLHSSLNIFERSGPSSKPLERVVNSSFAASTLASKDNLIFVDFDVISEYQEERFLSQLPVLRKIKSNLLYSDVQNRAAQIKIAWRYSNSPSDSTIRMRQVDFGLSMAKEAEEEEIGMFKLIKISDTFTPGEFIKSIELCAQEFKKTNNSAINIIIVNLLHPFSPLANDSERLISFVYALKCVARSLDKGSVIASYDCLMLRDQTVVRQLLYNIADSVVSFHSYKTGQDKLAGYRDTDGTLEYLKAPKINSFGFHFQQELSDWCYRFTKNHRFFIIDKLSLPPCEDDDSGCKPRC